MEVFGKKHFPTVSNEWKLKLKDGNMKRTACAHWEGNLREGRGTLTTQNGTFKKTNYSFKTLFDEEEMGINPEELLAATHAGCFTMAVCSILTIKGLDPKILDTEATVTMETSGITAMHLSIKGSVKGINAEDFTVVTKDAEKKCMISKVLNVPVSSEAQLDIID